MALMRVKKFMYEHLRYEIKYAYHYYTTYLYQYTVHLSYYFDNSATQKITSLFSLLFLILLVF